MNLPWYQSRSNFGLSFCVLNSESKMGVLILFCEEQFHVLFLIRRIVLTVVLTIVPCLCKKVLRFLFFLWLLRFCHCIREISPTVLQKESIHINQTEKETIYAIIKHVLKKDENSYLWLGLITKKSFFPKGPSSKNRGRPR